MNKNLKNRCEYALFMLLLAGLKILPYRFAYFLLSKFSIFCGEVLKVRYKLACQQLTMIFDYPPTTTKKVIREVYQNLGKMAAETYLSPRPVLLSKCQIIGEENLQAAAALHKGIIVVTGHFGNWELAGEIVAHAGYKVSAIMTPQRNTLFNKYTIKSRRKAGMHLINTHNAFKPILRALQKNEVVAFIADQAAGCNGILLDFLGRPASVHTGPAKIALKTGAPVVFAYVLRTSKGHNLYFDKPIFIDELPADLRDVDTFTHYLSQMIEKIIRMHPSQWFWVHKRWKKTEKARVCKLSPHK